MIAKGRLFSAIIYQLRIATVVIVAAVLRAWLGRVLAKEAFVALLTWGLVSNVIMQSRAAAKITTIVTSGFELKGG